MVRLSPCPPFGEKMLSFRNELLLKQAAALCRLIGQRPTPHSNSGFLVQSSTRNYRSQPTHGIGRFKHLLPPETPKKKDKQIAKEIKAGSDSEYGVLNMQVTGYSMVQVEHYTQYVHNLCTRLSVKVDECYAKPTRTKEVMLLQEHGNKMYQDAMLTTHERVVQVSGLSATLAPILMEVLIMNQPEGVQLLVKEHTEADYQVRFKARPELENLVASMS
ncbi:39S ribosomal protein L48, mitochondrial-like isoform X1 [Bombina bombina]|uniref:39S ribosomal protein L48, mitochondrial-like isoform X1 n=2 Tax=Bombina bombina TaxID=8345 RepID=UPI00235A542C|nr:39S ribosomal protein L48, mitochondrial-like isoform X1 [Bombina bombina]